ncbi:putative hydrolase or acyltransferase of alpha/beta superfamily [Pseudomonas sp. GM78]|uniref:alpha/beta fold hydrolase n=1 Tax=Pseudomonas sp. GM78 TaxID=1144337 RepID=UPI000270A279|nr:alpha/beta hydrolase [Pseudomonas sp. GM78]EJN22744.1 putative hydrolase or acyltransferase of alpha/beta superfamily [Pseudomonas sp. GM78]
MQVCITQEDHWVNTPYGQVFARCWYPGNHGVAEPTAPIVLFHDSLGCVELWRDFPSLLAKATNRNVVAYDRLGFGRSDPHPGDWSNDFIREEAQRYFPFVRASLGIERFIAFGHSVGGAMATHCAALFSEHCQALVTESAQAFVEERTLGGIRIAKEQFQQPGQIERLHKYHGEKAQWVLNAWTQTWLSPTYADWTIEKDLATIQCPMLVIHGAEDEFGSTLHPQRYANLARGEIEMLVISDCQHVPHREKTQDVIDAVCRLL